jgi:hypothetical protein
VAKQREVSTRNFYDYLGYLIVGNGKCGAACFDVADLTALQGAGSVLSGSIQSLHLQPDGEEQMTEQPSLAIAGRGSSSGRGAGRGGGRGRGEITRTPPPSGPGVQAPPS